MKLTKPLIHGLIGAILGIVVYVAFGGTPVQQADLPLENEMYQDAANLVEVKEEPAVQQKMFEDAADTFTESYVLNISTKKYHRPDCYHIDKMLPKNRKEFTGTEKDLLASGYKACKSCH